jgi:pimeloyl-ACP methyl ester carboxylesterase
MALGTANDIGPLEASVLPAGIRSRFVDGINGLRVHLLEAGAADRPCVLLLHGFPEIAYSWRKVMLPLAEAGYHVVAPDLRGYGRTSGGMVDYDGDLSSCRTMNLVRDQIGLLFALGHRTAAAVVGHDFGASVTAWCALVRPDIFRAMAIMSAPFAGPPAVPFDTAGKPGAAPAGPDIHAAMAALPRPRKHYQWYYSTRPANADMMNCRQGVHDFLRAYFHDKSADWAENKPHRLEGWTATELAKMPTYYIMDLHENMAETVAHEMPTPAQIAACQWLPDDELRVYSGEYGRVGFQGGLQNYRTRTAGLYDGELQVFTGRTIDQPSLFVSGKSDWGVYQAPGNFERMQNEICTDMRGCHLLDGAGHWVQQEQAGKVGELLVDFVRQAGR